MIKEVLFLELKKENGTLKVGILKVSVWIVSVQIINATSGKTCYHSFPFKISTMGSGDR